MNGTHNLYSIHVLNVTKFRLTIFSSQAATRQVGLRKCGKSVLNPCMTTDGVILKIISTNCNKRFKKRGGVLQKLSLSTEQGREIQRILCVQGNSKNRLKKTEHILSKLATGDGSWINSHDEE